MDIVRIGLQVMPVCRGEGQCKPHVAKELGEAKFEWRILKCDQRSVWMERRNWTPSWYQRMRRRVTMYDSNIHESAFQSTLRSV
jgi:hypothetical protein